VPKVILVVDDDRAVREVSATAISSFGYAVVTATNGNDALRIVESQNIDAIFTDVMMPGLNGYQLARRARLLKPNIPVICVTGFPDVPEDDRDCNELVQKPYRVRAVKKILNRLLAA
jgi:CheY-like chemotaxis protein